MSSQFDRSITLQVARRDFGADELRKSASTPTPDVTSDQSSEKITRHRKSSQQQRLGILKTTNSLVQSKYPKESVVYPYSRTKAQQRLAFVKTHTVRFTEETLKDLDLRGVGRWRKPKRQETWTKWAFLELDETFDTDGCNQPRVSATSSVEDFTPSRRGKRRERKKTV
eukprot:GHVH01008169.1.p1 GENE.GHVH01008169.1~~GHVH01008169.1.p1  ORF type:complete len:169 (+),score=21.01 GHVH01008169.1:117-623(+)